MAVPSTHAATIIAAAEFIKEEKRSYQMKKMWFFLMLVMVLAAMPSAFATGTASLTGTTACPSSNQFVGYTTVTWTTTPDEPNNVAMWANYYNANLTIIGSGIVSESRNGSSYYPYLSYGFTYFFNLESGEDSNYDEDSGNGLASVSVQC
jgi:hypothetical protein